MRNPIMKFLETIAQAVIKDLEAGNSVLIIVPNRRAGVFLQHYLLQNVKNTVYAPDIYSSEEFAEKISELNPAETLELIIKLYAIYKNHVQERSTQKALAVDGSALQELRLGDFFSLANILLGDFDEIDRYCADADAIFKGIAELATTSALSQKLQELWKHFGVLYHTLKSTLLETGSAYTGLLYRVMLDKLAAARLPYTVVYWAGLYALTQSEKQLFMYFRETLKSNFKVYLDLDAYFISNDMQEAGAIYRSFWKKQLAPDIKEEFSKKPITIHAIAAQGNVGIVKCAGNIIQNLLTHNTTINHSSIAIVFSDESLLIPMLNTVPEIVRELNVTMGLPLTMTKVYSFITLLFAVYNSLKNSDATSKEVESTTIRELLEHPYTNLIHDSNELSAVKQSTNDYIAKNFSYIPISNFERLPHLYQLFCTSQGLSALEVLTDIVTKLLQITNEQNLVFEREIIFTCSELLNKTLTALTSIKLDFSVKELHEMLTTLFLSKSIAFRGEPLQGMQFMGMLETQCLEFSTVIMLSANEGFLPYVNTAQSFIPETLRKAFGLPVRINSDEVTAYHFYRLISHADIVYLIYSDADDGVGKSEKSRFIYQLKYEYAQRNAEYCNFKEEIFSYPVSKQQTRPIAIKSDEMINHILQTMEYSASSLTCYNECTLKFFYTYVMKLKEFKDVEEDPDAAMIGTIVHSSLQKIFAPQSNSAYPRSFTVHDLHNIKTAIPTIVNDSIKNFLPNTDFTGNHYILNKAIVYFLEQYIEKTISYLTDAKTIDDSSIVTSVLAVETTYTSVINLPTNKHVTLKGTVDRAEKTPGHYLVLDFKTGDAKNLTIQGITPDETFAQLRDPKYKQALQLLIYTLVLHTNNVFQEQGLSIHCKIYSFKKNKGFSPLRIILNKEEVPITNELIHSFETWISTLLQTIIDTDVFTQTQNSAVCRLCPYHRLCMRFS